MVNGKGASGRNTLASGGLGTHGPSRGLLPHIVALGNVGPGFTDLVICSKKEKKKDIFVVFLGF